MSSGANESMKLAKLKRNLITRHPGYSDKSKELFFWKGEEYVNQRSKITNLATNSERAQKDPSESLSGLQNAEASY